MKRGQLAAVIIIVLLVAAVGGFVLFSESAGRAATLVDTAPVLTVSGAERPLVDTAVLTVSGARLSDDDLLKLLDKYKPFFSAHNDLTAPADERTYVLEPGVGQVLLTAPHSVKHIRAGAVKASDFCTGPIVNVLKDLTDAPIMFLQYKSLDPNFYDRTAFKSALGAYLLSHPEIKLVIDIHGAAISHVWDVDLGYMYGASLIDLKDLPSAMESVFKKYGISIISHNFFSASDHQTVTKFVSAKFKRNAIQTEINRRYRCAGGANDVALLRSLEEIIRKYR